MISERIRRLDRLLTQKRLYRGFGALTWGGFGGIITSLTALFTSLRAGNSLGECTYLILMAVGSMLCFVFAGLIFRGFHKKDG